VLVNFPRGWDEIAAFYGWDAFARKHAGKSGKDFDAAVRAEWEPRMVLVKAPPGCSFYFDADADGTRDTNETMRGIRVHPMVADELAAALLEISKAGLWRFVEACAGGYAFRMQRGSMAKVSLHSLGAAIDFDAIHNAMGADLKRTRLGTEPGLGVVRIFEARGWTWGGRFGRTDAMHVQAASGF
jgi:hypothetical protein